MGKPALFSIIGLFAFCLLFGLAYKIFSGPLGMEAYLFLAATAALILILSLFKYPRDTIKSLLRQIFYPNG